MSKKKIYGVVKAVKANNEGIYYAQVEDLNKEGELITICAGEGNKDKFGGEKLKEGMRIACTGDGEKVFLITGKTKVYKEHPKKGDFMKPMLFGNAVNVATAMLQGQFLGGANDPVFEDIFTLAVEVYEGTANLREEVGSLYPDVETKSIGLCLGDSLKRAAPFSADVESLVENTKKILALHIEYEKKV